MTPRPASTVPSAPPALDFASAPAAFSAVAEALRLAHGHQFNPAFASETSRIDLLPHQRIAVYERMLDQDPLRFLLADDAGAGKTVMTGLYVREMLSRGRIRRVLVVPPAGLVGNWERELRTLFRLSFRIVTGADARTGVPFRGPGSDRVIVSLDTLTGERTFEALREAGTPPYDLAVFDEAHKLAAEADEHRVRKTRRYELAEALAGCASPSSRFAGLGWAARHLLLLTATPHMGKDSPWRHLWRLLDARVFSTDEALRRFPREERRRHFIRRTKEEMVGLDGRPLYPRRACDTFSYDLSPGPDGEQALYDETTAYLRRAYGRALDDRPAVRLAMSVFQRRLASSTWALWRSFERRVEKLQRAIEDLQSGRVDAAELQRRQSGLDGRHRSDFFDTYGADEDALDDRGERNEEYEDAVLGALVAVTVEELRQEIHQLRALGARARRLHESGRESKFEKLREVLEDPRQAGEKWLVFTEHRDTLDYLVRRLEGIGFSGKLAQIHGGMAWPEREAQVERFRRPDGARYLVATDAAGEGINLQFCRLMVNYDAPWNPARLEQRMGRIHRYGQKHDVRIVNLVAGGAHEGRVLQVLLEKLDAIRAELRSDKVFDVVGRLFENVSLREYMIEALTDEGERRVVERIESALTPERVRGLDERERQVYGARGEVAERLDELRDEMEHESYLRLLPGYVRRFVEKAADMFGLEVRGDLDGFFSLVPGHAGAPDPLLAALESYPAPARERLCARRPETMRGSAIESDAPCIWLHPGEPVFDALSDLVLTRFGRDALRGAIFTDPRADAPYFFHLAETSVEREPEPAPDAPQQPELFEAEDAGRTDVGAEPLDQADGRTKAAGGPGVGLRLGASDGTDGRTEAPGRPEGPAEPRERQIVERRLLGLRQDPDGVAECPVERLLLLGGAPQVFPGAVPLAARAIHMRTEAADFAEGQVLQRLVAGHRDAARARLPDQRRRTGVGFDLRAAALAQHRTKLGAAGESGDAMDEVRQEQRTLAAEKERALAGLDADPGRIVPGGVRFLAHALVVPADDAGETERHDARVEEVAVGIALAWEREHGAEVRDVSRPELARGAGLPDWPGFDLLSTRPDGEVRNVEVKGRAGQGNIRMEVNEWKQACHLNARYWLYVVLDCATPAPRLLRVQDPFAKLLASRRDSATYAISAKALAEAAERG